MRVSTGGRYGLRVMLDIAVHGGERPVQRQDIADRQEISSEYIAHLIQRLTKDGLVRSIKGPGGGYFLNRAAGDIRIGDIFRAVEGPLTTVFCVLPDGRNECRRKDACAANVLWANLSRTIENYLDSVSLEDLARLAKKLEAPEELACLVDMDPLFKIPIWPGGVDQRLDEGDPSI